MSLFSASEFDTPRPRLSLDGEWAFSYDADGLGQSQAWFAPDWAFPERITVPGCSQAHPYESAGSYERLTDVEIPEHSDTIMLKYGCKHDSWYQKKFFLDAGWKGRTILLHIGGVKPAGEFWVNGQPLGATATSRSPVRCDVTPHLRFGEENTLTVRVFWPEIRLIGMFDVWHAWSGLYRSVWFEAAPQTRLTDIHVCPSIHPPAATVTLSLGGGQPGLRAVCEIVGADGLTVRGEEMVSVGETSLHIPMPEAKLWSPGAPNLYRATVQLFDGDALVDEGSVRFGLREIATEGFHVTLNGTPVFLRGGCDDQVYPDTVCPPADKEFFRERIAKAKKYGFNYVKSACENFTKEYLDAADELGYMVCQEMPFAALGEERNVRNDPPEELAALWRRELENIVRFSRNHPSIVVYSMNSETALDHPDPAAFNLFSREFPALTRRLDPRALVFDSTAAHHPDMETRHGRRDTDLMEEWMPWSGAVSPLHGPLDLPATITKPFILHEWNWITSIPNPSIGERYESLPLVPVQVPEMLEMAEKNGIADELPAMFEASNKLKYVLRKDALEVAFEHPKIAGYHHWLIHDVAYCPEGVFNEFWEEAPGMTAEEFRTYNDDTVLVLDNHDRRDFFYDEAVPLGILVAHFGEAPLHNAALKWQLLRDSKVLSEGAQLLGAVACGQRFPLPSLGIGALAGEAPAKLELLCELWDGDARICSNHWPLWFFPRASALTNAEKIFVSQPLPPSFGITAKPYDPLAPPSNAEIFVTHRLTDGSGLPIENLFHFIERGGRVLLLSSGALPEIESNQYRSVIFNTGTTGNMGTVVSEHPALGDFPHEGWCDLPFVPLIEGAYAMRLDVFGQKIHPIIRSIGHHMTMPDKGYLFEVGIGQGVLLVCSLNLQPHCHVYPAAQHLLWCLMNYLAGGEFAPQAHMTTEQFLAALSQ